MTVLKLKNNDTEQFETVEYIMGEQGQEGIQGEEGKTPVKGIDYFTEEEIKEMGDYIINNLPKAEDEVF